MVVSDKHQAPAKVTEVVAQGLGGSHGRSGELMKISPPPGFDPHTAQQVAGRG